MAASLGAIVKDPDEVLDYSIEYDPDEDDLPDGEEPYLESGETIDTSTWTVPTGITKDSDSKGATTVTIWLSGGTAGATYTISNKIVTTNSPARTVERSFDVIVRER